MNKEDQRIAIVEACGWTFDSQGTPSDKFGVSWPKLGIRAVPEYLTDLNACHEMEKVLNAHERCIYTSHLIKVVDSIHGDLWYIAHATAAQRCEAFLRTLNLWKDS